MLKELLEKIKKLEGEARALLDLAKAENRALTDEEQGKYDAAMNEIDLSVKQVDNLRRMESLEQRMRTNGNQGQINPIDSGASGGSLEVGGDNGGQQVREFRSLDEFAFCAFNPRERWPEELRTMNMTQGESGGFLVPEQYRAELLRLAAEQTIVRSRATVIPAGSPPDATIRMPALTQGDDGVLGGVTVSWIGEGATKPETGAKLHEVVLTPKELAAHIPVTDTLLRNAPAAGMFIRTMLTSALAQTEDIAFLRGDGIGKPLGVLNSACALLVNRGTAGTVEYPDVVAMKKMMLPESLERCVWVCSQSLMDHLDTLEDENGNYIYTGMNAEKKTPAYLAGIPLKFTGKVPSAGNAGDLMLVDFSYYLVKDGSGPSVAASSDRLFEENKTMIKAFMTVDGQCWVRDPLLLDDGVTYVSPVVVLQ